MHPVEGKRATPTGPWHTTVLLVRKAAMIESSGESGDHRSSRSPSNDAGDGDLHPLNPGARKGPNGIWNEKTVPVVEWEVPGHRKILPLEIQAFVASPHPVIRVPIEIHEKELTKHAASRHMYDDFERQISRWTHRGVKDFGNGDIRWRFAVRTMTPSGTASPYVFVIARRSDGSFTLVSGHYRTESYIRRLVREGELEGRGEERR